MKSSEFTYKKREKMQKKIFPFVSPLLVMGVLLIMLPIFTLMTLDRLERQNEFFTQRLLERGTSLIRTFEAGTRTGMLTMQWGAKRIQDMITETSFQPEVIYMMITTKDGMILAHSDASKIGTVFKAMPEVLKIDSDVSMVFHRVRQPKDTAQVFEVFKRFIPVRSGPMRGQMRMHSMPMHGGGRWMDGSGWSEPPDSKNGMRDWSRSYLRNQGGNKPELAEHYIFAGLSQERAELARGRLLKKTILRAVFFFLLGCAGIFALFVFQAYRSTKASLTSVKAFSDTVIQNMPSGLVTISQDHKITSSNRAAKEILGGNLTRPFPEMIPLIKQMERTQMILNKELNIEIDSGRMVRLDVTSSPIKESENQVMGFLFLFRDLTQIDELKKQVETNKRLAAIGKLAAGVAHEIRNPLSSIKGFATYFGKRYEKNASDKETAQIMVKEVERINRSITQLLEFAKPLAVEKKQVDIDKLISHSIKLVDHDLLQKKIETKIHIDTKIAGIYTDKDRINQVLLNLYINAIEALGIGGCLEVNVEDAKEPGFIKIMVKDNGIGIDDESFDLIFDPYFTTRSTGTGLGLSIVHRIIENLGGQICVKSKKGIGTCFIINLPVSK